MAALDMSVTFQDISLGYVSVRILIIRLLHVLVGDTVSVGKVEGSEESVGVDVNLIAERYILQCAIIRVNCPAENLFIHESKV